MGSSRLPALGILLVGIVLIARVAVRPGDVDARLGHIAAELTCDRELSGGKRIQLVGTQTAALSGPTNEHTCGDLRVSLDHGCGADIAILLNGELTALTCHVASGATDACRSGRIVLPDGILSLRAVATDCPA